jgi:hypothetical protein
MVSARYCSAAGEIKPAPTAKGKPTIADLLKASGGVAISVEPWDKRPHNHPAGVATHYAAGANGLGVVLDDQGNTVMTYEREFGNPWDHFNDEGTATSGKYVGVVRGMDGQMIGVFFTDRATGVGTLHRITADGRLAEPPIASYGYGNVVLTGGWDGKAPAPLGGSNSASLTAPASYRNSVDGKSGVAFDGSNPPRPLYTYQRESQEPGPDADHPFLVVRDTQGRAVGVAYGGYVYPAGPDGRHTSTTPMWAYDAQGRVCPANPARPGCGS